jgi:hypothetical protein
MLNLTAGLGISGLVAAGAYLMAQGTIDVFSILSMLGIG